MASRQTEMGASETIASCSLMEGLVVIRRVRGTIGNCFLFI